jgi:hypothetical protein
MRSQLVLVVGLLALLVAGSATGGTRSGPLPVSFSGRYAVTYKVTNSKSFKPTHWIFGPKTACKRPCRSVSFRQRLASEKNWRPFILTYTWNGDGYAIAPRVQRSLADCRGAADQTIRKGFDVTSTSTIRPARTLNGRVVRFTGTAEDAYIPNAAGRKAGCARGFYEFALTGASA